MNQNKTMLQLRSHISSEDAVRLTSATALGNSSAPPLSSPVLDAAGPVESPNSRCSFRRRLMVTHRIRTATSKTPTMAAPMAAPTAVLDPSLLEAAPCGPPAAVVDDGDVIGVALVVAGKGPGVDCGGVDCTNVVVIVDSVVVACTVVVEGLVVVETVVVLGNVAAVVVVGSSQRM